MSRDVITGRIERLWAAKTRFLEWLERRVGSRADAEDVLHTGLLQVVAKAGTLRDEERLVPWFEQILRHALVDHHRRRAAIVRAEQRAATETPEAVGLEVDEALSRAICTCVVEVLETLRPAQAELLRRIELEGESLDAIARQQGITANAAAVRLHRARRALRRALDGFCRLCAEHGHLDCECPHQGV
jgi:RNA polymerase sigma-70 factor (ECF subfamily)